MKFIINQCLLLLLSYSVFGGVPQWSVDYAKFSNTMTYTGVVQLSGVESSSKDDIVAAFAGDQCRGVANLLVSDEFGRYFVYLMVHSNSSSENISFKIYNSGRDTVIDVPVQELFVAEKSVGSQLYPYVFSDQTVDESQITKFELTITGSSASIDSNSKIISLSIPDSVSVDSLPVEFEVSAGAHVFVDSEEIASGDMLDFSEPVVFTVVSQLGTVTQWAATFSTQLAIGTAITSFAVNVSGAQISINDSMQQISVTVPEGTEMSSFVTNFSLSKGASLFIDSLEIHSGDLVDYSNKLEFMVFSEMGTSSKWTLSVNHQEKSALNDGSRSELYVSDEAIYFKGFDPEAYARIYDINGRIVYQLHTLPPKLGLKILCRGYYTIVVYHSTYQPVTVGFIAR